MNKRNESTLKVIQHEMYHAGKMQLKTKRTEFMGIFCMAALCLFTAVVCTQWAHLVLRCPGPMPEHPLKLLEHMLLSAVFSNRNNCTCTIHLCLAPWNIGKLGNVSAHSLRKGYHGILIPTFTLSVNPVVVEKVSESVFTLREIWS